MNPPDVRERIARIVDPRLANDEWRANYPEYADEVYGIARPKADAILAILFPGGALKDVAAERRRQVEAEGWSTDHDDKHDDCSLVEAAVCYAAPLMQPTKIVPDHIFHNGRAQAGDQEWTPVGAVTVPERWPWDGKWWKPRGRRNNLVRAAALIIAEIERLDRAALLSTGVASGDQGASGDEAPGDLEVGG